MIDADATRVFDVLAGLDAAPNWTHGILGIERLTKGPMTVGTRWREQRLVLGERIHEDVEVTHFDEPKSYGIACSPSSPEANGADTRERRAMTYTLLDGETPNQTVLRLDVRVDTPGLVGRMLNRFRIDTVRKMAEKDLFALKRFIETGRRASGVFIAVG